MIPTMIIVYRIINPRWKKNDRQVNVHTFDDFGFGDIGGMD
jgi:hypothetical protein